jgi:hypothetical protein
MGQSRQQLLLVDLLICYCVEAQVQLPQLQSLAA